MAAPQQAQGGTSDNSMSILWTIAGIFVFLGAIWFVFKDQIVVAYLTLKLYEVDLLSFFSPGRFDSLRSSILSAIQSPSAVSFQDLSTIGQGVGNTLRYPFVILLFAFAIIIFFGSSTRTFKKIYTLKNLPQLEKKNWPQISSVVGLDLIKTNIDQGPWAMALTPVQFCRRHKLLEEVKAPRREGMNRRELEKVDVVLKKGEANKLFALQLGPLWKGVDKLPPYARSLFAAFAARINADSAGAEKLLIQLSASSTTKMNFAGTDELLNKHLNTKLVQKVINSHAYMLTVMASMLESARDDGVQASADFLWLKPLDRRLWYTLNAVGRQTPFAEIAGIFAHWMAEKEAGRKLMVPAVEEATKALEISLREVVYRPEEENVQENVQ